MVVNAVARRIAQAVALGCAALLTLPGGVAFAEPPADPTPSISPGEDSGDMLISALSLQLSPPEGGPGTYFTATVTKTGINRSCSLVVLSWAYGTQLAALNLSTNTATATFLVQPDNEAGNHPVTASCEGATPGTADFTVLAPTLNPSLTLDRTEGPPGTPVTATVTDCRDAGSLLWDGDAVTEAPDGPFTVPDNATTGEHTVSVTCDSAPVSTTFTVIPLPPPTLELNRPDGPPGAEITASGTGFACGGPQVRLVWDDGTVVTTTSGSFVQPVTSPSAAGDHRLTASCTDNPEIATEALFTVTEVVTSTTGVTTTTTRATTTTTPVPVTENVNPPVIEPPTPPPPPPPVPFWLIALVIIAAVLAATGYRALRKQRETLWKARVHAVARPDGSPTVNLREAPGERSHAIRLDFVGDIGTHTIREVPP